MRSMWKGHIRFSMVTIPIRLYTAVDSGRPIRFNQLHKEDNGRVGYDKKCKSCGETLSSNQIVKGYEFGPDEYVIVEDEDFQKVRLKSTKIIEIEGFVDLEEIEPSLFDTPYYIGPDGNVAEKVYALLREALKQTGRMAVGRVVMRDREEVVLMGSQADGLIMYKLRYPQFVRDINAVPGLDRLEVEEKELGLAKRLIESMSTSLDDLDLKDRYHDAVKEMLQAKIDDKEVVTVAEDFKPVVDIMVALKESIEQAKTQKKPMKKATGRTKKTPAKRAVPKQAAAKKASPMKAAAKKASPRKVKKVA